MTANSADSYWSEGLKEFHMVIYNMNYSLTVYVYVPTLLKPFISLLNEAEQRDPRREERSSRSDHPKSREQMRRISLNNCSLKKLKMQKKETSEYVIKFKKFLQTLFQQM